MFRFGLLNIIAYNMLRKTAPPHTLAAKVTAIQMTNMSVTGVKFQDNVLDTLIKLLSIQLNSTQFNSQLT